MTPERWQQLKQIFQSALERRPAERSAFLSQACAGDPALRSEVESLISSHDQAGDSIEAMAAEAATEMLGNDRAIVGTQIGHYQVLNRIGRGGMGEVFLAQDTSLGRKVALKRGQAYLRQGSATEAIAEFQKIIDRRGVAPADPLYPLAYLGLARAAALTGDMAKSRKAYEDFFALWKDADPDIPILQKANQEYDKLK